MIKYGLIERSDGNDVVSLQNRVSGVQSKGLSEAVDGDGEARILPERSGAWDAEAVAVELYGGSEGRRESEKGGESERRDCASVAVGHYAFHRAVVGDAGIAEFHGGGGELYSRRLGFW